MGKKTIFLLAMAMLLLLPSQARAQDSPQQHVDLTTRKARTTHDGLRMIKNLPSKKIDVVAAQTDAAAVQTAVADKKRDAAVKNKAQEAAVASKVKDKKEAAIKRMAHHPAVSSSLRSKNAPQRAGEVRDDDGVIIKPAEGQRKIYNRSGNALIMTLTATHGCSPSSSARCMSCSATTAMSISGISSPPIATMSG